jgi:hypothetical protein
MTRVFTLDIANTDSIEYNSKDYPTPIDVIKHDLMSGARKIRAI